MVAQFTKRMTRKMCVIIDLSLSSVLSVKVSNASCISISSTFTRIFFFLFSKVLFLKTQLSINLRLFNSFSAKHYMKARNYELFSATYRNHLSLASWSSLQIQINEWYFRPTTDVVPGLSIG
jgi:hypothetical protein